VGDAIDQYLTDSRSPLAKLLGEGVVPHRTFEFRGAGQRFPAGTMFAVRAIDSDVATNAGAAAFRYLVDKAGYTDERLFTTVGQAALELETKRQILSHALVDPKDPTKPFATDVAEVRTAFESAEVVALYEQYADYQRERSPLVTTENAKEAEALLDQLGKGLVDPTSLSRFDSDTLRFVVRCGARMLRDMQTRLDSGASAPSS
jgi:hypothetical protein